jgi:two-component system sensor kinase FixL
MKSGLALLVALQLAANSQSVATTQARAAEQQPGGTTGTVPDIGPPRGVLALYSEPSDHPYNVTFDRQFHNGLKQSGGTVEHYAEYFESYRFPGERQARIMRDYLRQKYADRKIDVLFAWGPFTLEFLLTHRHELFPDTPIVYYVSTLESVKHLPTPPLTGVMNPDAYEKTLELALNLHPDAAEAFIISSTPDRDKLFEREASLQLERFNRRVKLTYLTDLPLDQLIATVKNLPRKSVILYSRQLEEPGRALQQADYVDLVSRSASVPVYGPWRSLVGNGSTGGVVDDPVAGATKAAEIVVRIARGARPQDIPAARVPKVPTFDSRQLKRWGISEAKLPPGSVVLFREPTLWSEYRRYLLATGVVFAVQTLLIAGLLVQRSKRRRVENVLRESEERFRVMADTAPVLVWRANVDKARDFFNRPWLEFRGRAIEQEVGSGWTEGVHPADLDNLLATYTSAFDECLPFHMEYRLQRADAEYRWVLDSGVPRFAADGAFLGYIGSCFDITERRQAEDALHQSQQRYALATAAGSVGVWDWNLETNAIYVDPELKRALGFADHEIENQFDAWSKHVHPEDAGRLLLDAQAHLDGDTPYFENERRMVHRDGSIRWFLTRGSVVRQPDGRVVRITGTDTDITERKDAEARLEDARREFTRLARVTTLAQFAASIAHEVSQPMSAILMNSKACLRWLAGSEAPTAELRAALVDIVAAANRAQEVMTRDRELFRHHAAETQPLDIKGVVSEVAALARTRLAQSHVRLTMTLDDTLPLVAGDRVELQQVLLNLLVNSIEAMEAVDPRSRSLTIETALTGEHLVQITVRDTGTGMRDVDVDRLFTPFYTTKAAGTGVGLSISRSIIEAHGGRLWAEPNDDGPGAAFHFTLLVATGQSTEEDAGGAAALDNEAQYGRTTAQLSSRATSND